MKKRWRIPPLPPFEPRNTDGAAVLLENIESHGAALWDLARETHRWATSAPRERSGPCDCFLTSKLSLLAVCCPATAELSAAWASGKRANHLRVGYASRWVSAWAEERGGLATAALFAEAAACACPASARFAYDTGRLLRRRAEYDRAESWLQRAVLLGRQSGDWRSSINARGGLGNLYVQRGNYPRAEQHHLRALHHARRHGYRDLEATAHHGLCGVAGERGRLTDMHQHARAAFEAFGSADPRIAALANDVADVWVDQGVFTPALQIFEATRVLWRSQDVVLGTANICRAAAGAEKYDRFESAWDQTWSLVQSSRTQENVAQALLDLARGASMLRDWERAEWAATKSLTVATQRSEYRVQLTAEAVLEAVLRSRASEEHQAETHTMEQKLSAAPASAIYKEASRLAGAFVQSPALCGGV